jgi:hypothetical protein
MPARLDQDETSGVWFQPGDRKNELHALPHRIVATIDDGSSPWDVRVVIEGDEATQAHIVTEVNIKMRPGGPPASAVAMKEVPVITIRNDAILDSIQVWKLDSDGKATRMHHEDSGQLHDARQPYRPYRQPDEDEKKDRVSRATRNRGVRRNAVTAEMRAGALALYEQAVANPAIKNPTRYVAEQIGRSTATANGWITKAREERGES